MVKIKEMDAESIAICAELYQNVYKNDPWNEEYSIDEIADYLFRFANSKTKSATNHLLAKQSSARRQGTSSKCLHPMEHSLNIKL